MGKSVERLDLERQATQLGAPWTFHMTDDELRLLIQQQTKRVEAGSMSVEQRDGVLYIQNNRQPECFGICWSAVGDEACQRCAFKSYCLDVFARTTLPKAQNGSTDVAEIAKRLELPEEAVVAALQYRLTHITPPEQPETQEAESEQPVKSTRKKKKPVKKKKKKKKKPAKKVAAKVEEKEKPPATKKTMKKKRRPRKAGAFVSRALAPAKSVFRSAIAAQARDGHRQIKTIEQKRKEQWLAERMRIPEFGRFVPGSKITREYKGYIHQVEVHDGYYKYDGELFSTLGRVTSYITGKKKYPKQYQKGARPDGTRSMGSWSAKRFWGSRGPKDLEGLD
jgi:hypothetical protein